MSRTTHHRAGDMGEVGSMICTSPDNYPTKREALEGGYDDDHKWWCSVHGPGDAALGGGFLDLVEVDELNLSETDTVRYSTDPEAHTGLQITFEDGVECKHMVSENHYAGDQGRLRCERSSR